MKEVRDVAHRFFDLPYEEKLKIKLSAETGYRSTFLILHEYYFGLVQFATTFS